MKSQNGFLKSKPLSSQQRQNKNRIKMDTKLLSRPNFETVASKAGGKKRRNSNKSHEHEAKNRRKDGSLPSNAASVFDELLILNSPSMDDAGHKPRSHANARERDRTHRCVKFALVCAYRQFALVTVCKSSSCLLSVIFCALFA